MYELSELILTSNDVFVKKSYSSEGMVKICTIENIINKISILTYMIKYILLWHSRLAPIDISTM